MKQQTSILAQGLTVVGTIAGDGLVEVRGSIKGDLNCTSVVVAKTANFNGTITAQEVIVDGAVAGPILGGNVTLKSRAHLTGDIRYQSIAVEKGAFVDARLTQGTRDSRPEASRVFLQGGASFADRHRAGTEGGGRHTEALLDGKDVLVASILCFALISLLTWVIAG
jgi:cytoskeletal protein CcmA (bactofilin family)